MKRTFTKYPSNYVKASDGVSDSLTETEAMLCEIAMQKWLDSEQSTNEWLQGEDNERVINNLLSKLSRLKGF